MFLMLLNIKIWNQKQPRTREDDPMVEVLKLRSLMTELATLIGGALTLAFICADEGFSHHCTTRPTVLARK